MTTKQFAVAALQNMSRGRGRAPFLRAFQPFFYLRPWAPPPRPIGPIHQVDPVASSPIRRIMTGIEHAFERALVFPSERATPTGPIPGGGIPGAPIPGAPSPSPPTGPINPPVPPISPPQGPSRPWDPIPSPPIPPPWGPWRPIHHIHQVDRATCSPIRRFMDDFEDAIESALPFLSLSVPRWASNTKTASFSSPSRASPTPSVS
mmetsp:Transcript_45800/g.108784  ORF Transcript_45800/g.108784 Transcript_45800/m.108784 type:complete len:205 (-) Transcript_45800:105-719(-)